MKVLIVGGGNEPSGKLLEDYSKKVDKIIGVDRGCSYLLKNYTLYLGDNRTVSNEFLEEDIEVEFTKGKILVIFSKD